MYKMIMTGDETRARSLVGKLSWLFPVTYVLHLAEEYWGGEGFPSWLSRVAKADLSRQDFLILNGIGLILMITASILARAAKSQWWMLVNLGSVVLLNGALHFAGSLITATYSPGVITGTLIWVPLGLFTLARLRALLTRRAFAAGLITGCLVHGVVSLLAFAGGSLFEA